MQNRPFSPTRTGGILPPLSKYYYGPAVSPDRTPVDGESLSRCSCARHTKLPNIAPDTRWNHAQILHQDPPALPPRQSALAPPTSQQQFAYHDASRQQIRLPGPPPTPPPAHPVARSSYNPNNYGLMPGTRHSPINTTWNQSSTTIVQGDTSTWGVNYHHNDSQLSPQALKPPLPVSRISLNTVSHLPDLLKMISRILAQSTFLPKSNWLSYTRKSTAKHTTRRHH